ncbi:protein ACCUMULATION AND REPLICATION OF CHLOROPLASTS 6, chloroplastic-like [Dorcoceras hygrometricum]|uniref:Protein ACCUMULATION AND REPLICATION OF CHLOROPLASTS 6, chloroplastic-like n=1 Tax=Dorcoceras hygrometricum TaxID=472368 RepID=A0A2Z7AB25_9LAMI|nr:protein ACCUMULATION AND REPLICATION OF CHLOROPLASTS 6, chloroplastic-like [Dorcoceras hygrometricum]
MPLLEAVVGYRYSSRRRRSVDGAGTKKFSRKLQLKIQQLRRGASFGISCDDISLDVITISKWSEAQKAEATGALHNCGKKTRRPSGALKSFWKLSNGKKISRGYIFEATPIEVWNPGFTAGRGFNPVGGTPGGVFERARVLTSLLRDLICYELIPPELNALELFCSELF